MANAKIVINRAGAIVASGWTTLAPDEALPSAGPVIVPLARLLAETDAVLALPGGIGVLIGSDEHLEQVVPLLPRLALVAVGFPKFRDGRGFSHIRALRDQHGWTGVIRAVGDALPDQFLSLVRLGVSSVELGEGEDPASWSGVLALRGGLDNRPAAEQPLPLLRRLAARFAA
jgi:uncharacterized protein (DUF934 family)